jgi:hypothetical protein
VNTAAVAEALASLLGAAPADVAVTTAAAALACAAPPAPTTPPAPPQDAPPLPARRLLQSTPPAPTPAPPAPPVPSVAAVAIAVTTRVGTPPASADVALALAQLAANASAAAPAMLLDAIRRSGEARASGVRLAPAAASASVVTISAAPAPPAAPPPAAPVATPEAVALGTQLLPLRIVLAVLAAVVLCCCLPCVLIGIAGWKAAVNTVTLIGVRGTWAGEAPTTPGGAASSPFYDVPLLDGTSAACVTAADAEADADAGASQPTSPRSSPRCASAAALADALRRFFNAQLDANTVRSLSVRSLRPAEAALRAPLLWRQHTTTSFDEDDTAQHHRPRRATLLPTIMEREGLAPGDAVEAAFELSCLFRSPKLAWRWRASLDAETPTRSSISSDGGDAAKSGMASALAAALSAAPGVSIDRLQVSLVLQRATHAVAPNYAAAAGTLYGRGGGGGGTGSGGGGALPRRATLYVDTHALSAGR